MSFQSWWQRKSGKQPAIAAALGQASPKRHEVQQLFEQDDAGSTNDKQ